MADTVQFNLVSPERSLASMQVNEVQIPGSDGDMTAMADHAPTITTLRPGVLKVTGPEGDAEYVVTGGFAEIGESGISVLAERAIARADMDQATLKGMVDAATDAFAKAQDSKSEAADDIAKTLADTVALGDALGISVN
ncbi:ATP synthase F1 subcomplex epsilon subunit [Planktotalea frisia]|jgi:F-type H+-transporting ATPase subunit epsilon|uniref:ATP synthase epsilon chain n=1 Tax=Planktotalea frisia TaxID=696762 RepID=A0A1L9P113_9RHOB|nr:F0F1 ATP synthase subunit epsilon [Planktotalea frisia]MDB9707030.1 F0F1 ATP synthase subunit epsilon [Planktotalea frisia]OJI95186.1 ATP synthase epsilon chain [Planktotalea frisia]PZX31798.1 ATP synthase F1 subcomplex epsilon subunit [Planktotalea frisia]